MQGVLDQGLIQISRQVSSPESQEQEVNVIIPCFNIPEKVEIAYHPREPVVICPPDPMPYTSDKAVPYHYTATIIENGKEVEIKTLASVTNITANSRMTRSGRVFAPPVIPSRNVEKDPVVVVPVTREAEGQTSNSTLDKETDELLRIIKLSDYKVEGSAMSPAEDEKEALISPSRSNTEVSIPQRVKKVDIQKLQGISCCFYIHSIEGYVSSSRITPCIPSGVLRKVQSSYTSQIQEPQGISCIFEVEGISILLRNPQQRQTFKETWIWCSCTNSPASLCTTPQRVLVQISSKSLCSC
ncbi:hypothetical protein KIW84_055696 [Lathyrus oleraceus]|uniref:Uncharacterized protein n=1 Tax=Pisum sativum TaxID=3888 RepID=A0A9D4WYI8_PEA|nr:hypothetical protein KIW84_055696 [Pisum sativum]